jgi:hypothetical protein
MPTVLLRLAKARNALWLLKPLLKSPETSLQTKLHVYKALVFSIGLHAVEAIHMNKMVERRFKYFERGTLMTMLNVSPFEHVSHDELVRRAGIVSIIILIRRLRLSFAGHILRHEDLIAHQLAFSGGFQQERRVGRQGNVLKTLPKDLATMSASAMDRIAWKNEVHTIN